MPGNLIHVTFHSSFVLFAFPCVYNPKHEWMWIICMVQLLRIIYLTNLGVICQGLVVNMCVTFERNWRIESNLISLMFSYVINLCFCLTCICRFNNPTLDSPVGIKLKLDLWKFVDCLNFFVTALWLF